MTKNHAADKTANTSARKAAATLDSQAAGRPVGGKSTGGRRSMGKPTPDTPTFIVGGLPGDSSPVNSLPADPATTVLSTPAEPEPAKPPTPHFKQLARIFDLDGRPIRVITRWYNRKPNVPGAMKDPERPGTWISQHVDCRATYETYWPEGSVA